MSEDSLNQIKIGILSDTHIPSRGPHIPEQIINDFKEKNVEYVFHLGDFTNGDVYKKLVKTFGKDKFLGISGNMDGHEINKLLPKSREIELMGYKIFLIHGSGGPKRIIQRLNKRYNLSGYDIVIFGHIHHPINEEHNGILYINPGTPTDKRFTDVNSYGILTLKKENIEFQIIEI